MACYCFTITVSPNIARRFQVNDYDRANCVFFCGSKFDSQESCLDFANEVERLKNEINETNWTIYAGKNGLRFPWMRL